MFGCFNEACIRVSFILFSLKKKLGSPDKMDVKEKESAKERYSKENEC
jgi:hypothetical protein